MDNLNFFIQIFSLMAGMPVIILAIIFYIKNKKSILLTYVLFFMGIYSFIMNGVIIDYIILLEIDPRPLFLSILNGIFANIGPSLFFICGPVMIHLLFNLKIKAILIITIIISIAYELLGVLFDQYDNTLFGILVIVISVYMLIISVYNFSKIGDKTLKKSLKLIFILSGINLIFLVMQISNIKTISDFGILGFSLFFLTVCILNIIFCINFFSSEPYSNNNEISDSFVTKFGITPREKEIISKLLEGISVNDLGEELFISPKTVANHIHNIYQKTEVKNRVQLINLIKSRS